MLPIRTILHPTDFSDRAREAFRFATALARDYGANLIVLHVSPEPVFGFAQGVVPPDPEVLEHELRDRLHHYVTAESGMMAEEQLRVGDPAREIVRFAEEQVCSMIVMGTHGHSGFGRLMLGSVAEGVMRQARCPVMTLREPYRTMENEPIQESVMAMQTS